MAEYESYDIYKALTVKQPYANDLVTVAYQEDGVNYGIKSIEVRSRNGLRISRRTIGYVHVFQ